jgi:hypothetical protein
MRARERVQYILYWNPKGITERVERFICHLELASAFTEAKDRLWVGQVTCMGTLAMGTGSAKPTSGFELVVDSKIVLLVTGLPYVAMKHEC